MGEIGYTASTASVIAPAWTPISLRRSGQRPLRFRGALVLSSTRAATEQTLGYTVCLFETADGQMAIAVELWAFGCNVPTATAKIVRTAEELVEACESFDPRERVSMDFSRTISEASADAVAIKLAIVSRLETTEADYRSTILKILRDPHAQPAAA